MTDLNTYWKSPNINNQSTVGFDDYIKSLNCRITVNGAKWKMLRALYENVGNFISSEKMMEISGNQPEFARRLRELRDNCG